LAWVHSSTTGGAQQDHVVGGSQRIALGMAQTLGQRIVFNALARRITQDGSGVTVMGDGFTVRANRVVVAMSPWVASRLDYSPMAGNMPARLQLMQRVPMGSVWKVHAVYDRPFWRDQGLSGQVSSDAFLTKVTFDVSPAEPNGPGIMMGFIEGHGPHVEDHLLRRGPFRRGQARPREQAGRHGSADGPGCSLSRGRLHRRVPTGRDDELRQCLARPHRAPALGGFRDVASVVGVHGGCCPLG